MKKFYQNKKIVITGASSGIGEYLALELARLGAKVILLARREFKLQALAKKIQEQGFQASYYPLNVSDSPQVIEVCEKILKNEGTIDILINNAGIMKLGPFEKLTLNQHETTIQTNLLGSIYLTHAFLPHFQQNNSGHLVFVSSLVGHVNLQNFNTYSATKFALVGLAEGLKTELRGKNIFVHLLCPPATDTPLLENADSAQVDQFRKLPIAQVGNRLIQGIAKKKYLIFCSWDSQLLVWIKRICPRLAEAILAHY
ncbi:MAG: SDR family NAD(P)-dependent oxidoreductase [Planctomycetota bacterium]